MVFILRIFVAYRKEKWTRLVSAPTFQLLPDDAGVSRSRRRNCELGSLSEIHIVASLNQDGPGSCTGSDRCSDRSTRTASGYRTNQCAECRTDACARCGPRRLITIADGSLVVYPHGIPVNCAYRIDDSGESVGPPVPHPNG